MSEDKSIKRAAKAINDADALLVGAGAGMGVDSGLPDFRGDKGFWKAYPPYEKLGYSFVEMANPEWFSSDPEIAWGFYGHRLNLYRSTTPHEGFEILRRWGESLKNGLHVFTSNVDGQFQRAGYPEESIVEVHGAIDWFQCTKNCGIGLFPAGSGDSQIVTVDESSMRAQPPLPSCPQCGGLARPNILMFGDWGWDSVRSSEQHDRLRNWIDVIDGAKVVVVECGAGSDVPTVRHFCESVASSLSATLIRINPREPQVPSGQIGFSSPALETLSKIDALVKLA